MVFRKLILVFAIAAGLFAFNSPVGCTRLPQVAQTELVVPGHEQNKVIVVNGMPSTRPLFIVLTGENLPASSFHHYHHSLLVESQQHHCSL